MCFFSSNNERMRRVLWFVDCFSKWGRQHPIPKHWLATERRNAKLKKSKDSVWKLITKKAELHANWSQQQISDWLFTKDELILKGGISSWQKARCLLYKSLKTIQLYVCVSGSRVGSVLCDGMLKAMSNIYDSELKTTPKRVTLYVKV